MAAVTFPLTGEPLILDLINTRPRTPEGRGDLLSTPESLRAWLAVEADRLASFDRRAPSAADLAGVHAVREHAAKAVEQARHGKRPPVQALRALTEAQRGAPAYRELDWDGSAVIVSRRRTGSYGARLAAELAESAADLLGNQTAIAATRQCQAPDCVLLFHAAHPRRQWCSANRCGNRARVARYYQRHKET